MRGGRIHRGIGERGGARGGAFRGGARIMRGGFARGRGERFNDSERPEYVRERPEYNRERPEYNRERSRER
jgi:hypothetical protein